MSLMEKAEELGKALVESSEYKELKSLEADMQNDEEARSLLEELEAQQKRVQMAQANGQQITADQQKNLQTLQTKMQANEKIADYMTAQQEFNKVMQNVNQVITTKMQGNN